jgi:serine/threonine-protein kinase HipA
MVSPRCLGSLSAQQIRGRKAYSFAYHPEWIDSQEQILLDPDISWFRGQQYPGGKDNFGVFLDSMPDTWGRTLMKKRAAIAARENGRPAPVLHDIDFLLGVHDLCRMGAIRFKREPEGAFLDNDPISPAPPWTSIRELQYSAEVLESDADSTEISRWIALLMAPGSSLGGARPKANIPDPEGHLWIAKFPSKNDTFNKGAWEFLAYRLAIKAGIEMAECKLEHVSGRYDTFFTKRFDRNKSRRIHFASAMTMTGLTEELIRDTTPSYLDIVEFIQFNGTHIDEDLHQLWRRIIFNILISNNDDHLRNHGFILTPKGWKLSPAYDINPCTDKDGLAININQDHNAQDIELAKSVGALFRLGAKDMNLIIDEVTSSVSEWQQTATQIGIPRSEQTLMAAAFRV